jgi:hypothetical protein
MKTIKLTQGQVAIVDDSDFERINQWKWHAVCAKGKWYARSVIMGKNVWMHHLIIKQQVGQETDHKSGNGLDNRQRNLRTVTHAVNCKNRQANKGGTSKYKGVYWFARIQKWSARIKDDGKNYFLGNYNSEKDAALAYNVKSKELKRTRRSRNFD